MHSSRFGSPLLLFFYFILFLFLGAKVSPELVAEKNKHYIRGLCEHFTIFCRMYSVRGAVQNKISFEFIYP